MVFWRLITIIIIQNMYYNITLKSILNPMDGWMLTKVIGGFINLFVNEDYMSLLCIMATHNFLLRINKTLWLISLIIYALISGTFHQRQVELPKMQWSIGGIWLCRSSMMPLWSTFGACHSYCQEPCRSGLHQSNVDWEETRYCML